jgi:transposase
VDQRFLEACLEQGMSLEAIGREVGKHPSTVSYWLKKHELTAAGNSRHAPKGGLRRDQLVGLIEEGLTVQEIAEQLNRGVGTVRHWMSRHGLRTARRKGRKPAGRPKRARMPCRNHGVTEFVLEGRGYYRCTTCRARAVAKRRRIVKRTLVEEAGGCCALCGYSRCLQALHFHHVDPTTKFFHLGDKGHARGLERSRREAQKCVLLCGNCHAEVEAGSVALPVDFQKRSIRSSNVDCHDPG